MSKRMIRRLDMITAYGRWAALAVISLVALLTFPSAPTSPLWTVLAAVAAKAVLDAIPLVMLYFKFYPDYAALTFSILDSIFALVLIYLGGAGMFLYAFFPALTLAIRFDWGTGLGGGLILGVGYVLLSLLQGGLGGVEDVILLLTLVATTVFCGLMAEHIKREPPLNAEEVREREEEIRRLRAAVERARAVYEMTARLSATLNYQRILEAVLEIGASAFDESTKGRSYSREQPAGAVFLYGEEGLYIAAARNLSYEERDLPVKGEKGVLDLVLNHGEAVVTAGLADDPELRQFAPFRRSRSAICVPLRAGLEIYGAVLFTSPRPNAFADEHLELLTAVANQAAVALTNAQLYRDLQEEKEHIIEVEEEARTKLARDLHDGPTQSISAIAMRLNFARLLLDRNPQKVKEELFKLENLARRTTKEIRTMLFTLRPVVLETQGLKAAVEQLIAKLKETGDLPVILEIEEDLEEKLDTNIKAVAWFITEEALNNAKKYAQADHIWVRMYTRDNYFIAEIEDDGKGFDLEATLATYDQRGSFGLLNLQERADLVNGRTTIKSAPGKGTKVTLVVPLIREPA